MYSQDFTIVPTNACDMNCEFCHENKCKERIDLSNEKLESFIENIVSRIDNIQNGIPITLFGGEPLLNKNTLVYLSKHKYAGLFDIRILTNLNKFEFDDLYIFSAFKKVFIATNLDVFQNQLFYRTEKYKIIQYLQQYTNIEIKPHCIISKDKMSNLLYYAPKLKDQIKHLKEIGLKFEIIFPQENDYTVDDYVNLITFYNYMNEEDIFNYKIIKIANFVNFIEQREKPAYECNLKKCSELMIKPNGKIVPCNNFYNYEYSEKEIELIELNAEKCNKCKFNSFCIPCKYNHYGTDNTELKCKRVHNIIKAIEQIELHGLKQVDETLYILSINVGSKCNKHCYFCYVDKEDKEEINLNDLESFFINNYWKIKTIDSLVGGEPLLYIDGKYEFLKKYIDKLEIISNIYIKNEYVRNNSDFIKITMSIQDKQLDKLNYKYYKNNIVKCLVLLNNEVLENIFETIKLLELNKIHYKFIELYSYNNGDNLIDKSKLSDILRISNTFKNIKYAVKEKIRDKYCIRKKIHINKNIITLCDVLFDGAKIHSEEEQYILSKDLKNYMINSKDIIEKTGSLKCLGDSICIANQYSVYENIDICKQIREWLHDK